MSHIVDQFYEAIRTGDTALLDSVIAEAFCLICPTQDHVLSGIYEGKQRFLEEVTPRVFGCVNPEEITFCADHRVVFDGGEVVVAMAQNNGVALTGKRYDQTYVHIFKVRDGQIHAIIECFDSALANKALWDGCDPVIPDTPAGLSNLSRFNAA
ncbi:MAG: nuclear transport factor 2 family protein [Proteobacteria bacterium]|nr:nuclear transport factor 2 family protein [Pseudomonadota bacterium]